MDFKIVIISDNLTEKDPFVQYIRMHYEEADNNHVFQDPDKGLEYVLDNLNNKMIVFIDWFFSGHHKNGIDLLKEIRKKTSLLYIVMMSTNLLRTEISQDSIIELINEDNIFYINRSNGDFESVVAIIDKIRSQWSTKFDYILEQWLIRHPEDNGKEAFCEVSCGKAYTWGDILVELRQRTVVGRSFEKMLNEYYIYQLTHSKK